jgi:hypothetical protein
MIRTPTVLVLGAGASLGYGFQRFGENELSVVTFNYDRSLEAFLHR